MEGIKKSLTGTLMSVGPVIIVIFLIQGFLTPLPGDLMSRFLVGAVLVYLGLVLFDHGVSMGMEPMGSEIGIGMTRSRKLLILVVTGLVIGISVTLAEPSVQVQISEVAKVAGESINSGALLWSISGGVGLTLVLSLLRILFQFRYSHLLWLSYAIMFILAAFAPPDYVPIAFDSGGATTGPMTVPFIMSMGVGVASIRSDKSAEADSFGLVGLVSVGSVVGVLLMGVFAG